MTTINLYGATTYYLQGSITATQTSITLVSFLEPVTLVPITMSLMNTTTAYATISPRTNQSEFISFTGITQNADTTATLTGVTRGLKRGYDYTSSTAFKLPHAGGTQFILGDSPAALNAFLTGGGTTNLTIGASTITSGTTKRILYDLAGTLQESANLQWDNSISQLVLGSGNINTGSNQWALTMAGSINNYYDVSLQNLSTGGTATSDIVLSADNDNPSLLGHYADFGITNSGYNATNGGFIKSVSINAAGTGYTANDILVLTGGDNNGSVTVVTVNGSGAVTSIAVNLAGTGYSVASGLATTGGTGNSCTINVVSLLDFTEWSAGDTYLYSSGGNLVISTDGSVANKSIKFTVGGIGTTNEIMKLTSSGMEIGLGANTAALVSTTTLVQYNDTNGTHSDWSFNVAGNGIPTINLQSTGGTLAAPTASTASPSSKSFISTFAYNSTPAQKEITRITSTLVSGTAGAETSNISFSNIIAGTLATRLSILSTGIVSATGGIVTTSPSSGIGYATGAGSSATQSTNKSTTVSFNANCGTITMNNAALASQTTVSFTFTNTSIASTDMILINHQSAGTLGAYTFATVGGSGTSTISVRNVSGGSLSEAIVLQFIIIKAVTS